MAAERVTSHEIVDAWNEYSGASMGYSYFSEILNGKRQFKLDFCYFILDYLETPHEQFSEYFPKGGYAHERSA